MCAAAGTSAPCGIGERYDTRGLASAPVLALAEGRVPMRFRRLATGALLLAIPLPAALADGNHLDIDRLTAAIEASEAPAPELLLLRARLLRAHGKPLEALADCDRIRALAAPPAAAGSGSSAPSPALAPWEEPLERALSLVDLSRDEEASPLLRAAIAGAPASAAASALDARCRVLVRAGDREGALADATAAFAREPSIDRALRRGELLVARGALDEAARCYRETIASLGDSLLLKDAWIGVEIARGEFESALALIDGELERAAVRTSWLIRRAEVYGAAGNDARRLEALREALLEADRCVERRRLPIHLVTRGRIRLALGDPAAARSDAAEARRLAPEFPAAAELLEAIEASERSGTREPTKETPGER